MKQYLPVMPAPHAGDDLLRTAFDLSPSGLLAVDAAGAIVLVNREIERLFGWPRAELLGQSLDLLVPERLRGHHAGHRTRYFDDPEARPMGAGRELYGLRRDGREFPVEIGLNPIRAGDTMYVLATVVDITARRSLEESQRRAQKLEAIGTLAGGIAHDFGNLLLGVVGHTELALRDPGIGAASRGDLEQVLRGAERGRELVKRILLFSRDAETELRPLRLDAAVGEGLHLLRATLPASIEMRAALDPETPAVLADETQLHQVLMNLVNNAAHASAGHGVIAVEVAPFCADAAYAAAHPGIAPGDYARLTVADEGLGMGREVLERALEPFFTTKPPGEGSGLGLSIAHGIARRHGGALDLQSAPGRGTRVTLVLPAHASAAPVPATREPGGAQGAGVRVLFVEDEEVLAAMQRRQLEFLGHNVTPHTSSLAALEDFRRRPEAFDLLITDDAMPEMSGAALATAILALRPGLPVLLVSGGDRPEGRAPGIRRVLRKPHTAKELDQAIRAALAPERGPAS